MAKGKFWGLGLTLGAGIVVGAAAAVLLTRGRVDFKKTAATLLSHGLDLKDKAATLVETARENFEDITAEARQEQEERRNKA